MICAHSAQRNQPSVVRATVNSREFHKFASRVRNIKSRKLEVIHFWNSPPATHVWNLLGTQKRLEKKITHLGGFLIISRPKGTYSVQENGPMGRLLCLLLAISNPGLGHKFPVLRTSSVAFSSPRFIDRLSLAAAGNSTMSVPMSLRRSSQSIHHLLPIQRLPSRQFSSEQTAHSHVPPPSAASAPNSDHSESSANRTFLKWMSGFATCSGLGLLYWRANADLGFSLLKTPVSSFSDASAASGESFEFPASSSSEVHKLSFPDHSSKFLFGGVALTLSSLFFFLLFF